ncbi:MAG: peptide chain release factor 1 [Euryarchaeota archaeon]|jgi:peptide chain release factor subunit 1|nr:peptide chain release factor 1 [Euryarchaeota archaeon]|tara:strand:+ start:60790 stop:61983 length:1194 start_codon:yes stop_codon:yes gene_type:complete
MAHEEFEMKKKLKHLGALRGRHTEFITVYISAGYDLNKTVGLLSDEIGTASNIKSKATKKHVTNSLEKIIGELRLFKKTPENGLAIFCGNVAEGEGQTDYLIETIIPPEKLSINLYRCSKTFVLEPLLDLLEHHDTYGIILVDRRDADIGTLKGKRIEILASLDSLVPGKFRAGGQSAQRFERVIEGMAQDFYKKVSEAANKEFGNIENLKGIVLGGPGPTKNDFLDAGHLRPELVKKILGIVDTGYTGKSGIDEMLHKSDDIIAESEIIQENKLLEKYFEELSKKKGLATIGYLHVKDLLQQGAVETLLISEKLDKPVSIYVCEQCGKEYVDIKSCSRCEMALEPEAENIDIADELTELANTMGSSVEIIGTSTQLGIQFYSMGTGIGAFLRYRPK